MNWPNLTIDQRAWELAKTALGKDAPTRDLIAKAQEIKDALKKGETKEAR